MYGLYILCGTWKMQFLYRVKNSRALRFKNLYMRVRNTPRLCLLCETILVYKSNLVQNTKRLHMPTSHWVPHQPCIMHNCQHNHYMIIFKRIYIMKWFAKRKKQVLKCALNGFIAISLDTNLYFKFSYSCQQNTSPVKPVKKHHFEIRMQIILKALCIWLHPGIDMMTCFPSISHRHITSLTISHSMGYIVHEVKILISKLHGIEQDLTYKAGTMTNTWLIFKHWVVTYMW